MVEKALFQQMEDRSHQDGDQPGFEFGLKCPSCKKVWTSGFTQYEGPSLGGAMKKFFKSGGDSAGDSAGQEAWAKAKAKAFTEAGGLFEQNFIFCGKCEKYVCQKCWNSTRDMCLECCVRSAQVAYVDSMEEAQKKARGEADCPKCKKSGQEGKFCIHCGTMITPKDVCSKCQKKYPHGAVFCPECGNKL